MGEGSADAGLVDDAGSWGVASAVVDVGASGDVVSGEGFSVGEAANEPSGGGKVTLGVGDGALVLRTTASGTPHVVPLWRTGTPVFTPTFSASPGSLAFGSQAVGSTSPAKSVVVTNHGTAR